MKRKYELTCSRCGYLAGQIVLSGLSSPAVISVLLCPAPPNIKANCPDRGGVGSRLLCLHRSAWNTGLLAESSKFFLFSVVTLHVLLQRHLPSMWFEEQVCFPMPDFRRRHAPREPGPAWFTLGLAGQGTKVSLFWVYPFKQYILKSPFPHILKRNNTCPPL